jgi:hypothetical protein
MAWQAAVPWFPFPGPQPVGCDTHVPVARVQGLPQPGLETRPGGAALPLSGPPSPTGVTTTVPLLVPLATAPVLTVPLAPAATPVPSPLAPLPLVPVPEPPLVPEFAPLTVPVVTAPLLTAAPLLLLGLVSLVRPPQAVTARSAHARPGQRPAHGRGGSDRPMLGVGSSGTRASARASTVMLTSFQRSLPDAARPSHPPDYWPRPGVFVTNSSAGSRSRPMGKSVSASEAGLRAFRDHVSATAANPRCS